MNYKFLVIDKKDNVMVLLDDYQKGDIINGIELKENIKKGHKVALVDIKSGVDVIKYSYPIGKSIKEIKKGEWVHTHNMKTNLDSIIEYEYKKDKSYIYEKKERMVNVFKRENGEVGIRNEIWIIPSVSCVIGQARIMIDRFKEKYSNLEIDGVYTFSHPYGCSQMGDDGENTLKSLVNIIKHPNAGGVLVLGLGCENTQIHMIQNELEKWDDKRIKFLNVQEVEDEIDEGIKLLDEIYHVVKNDKREKLSLSNINLGLECGGSDAFSGVCANPLIGILSDEFIKYGATCVLTEIPEMFGAEHILLNKCKNKEVFEKLVNVINDFKKYYESHNQVIYDNPSYGNKEGGISSLEDKSLGCIRKAGSSEIVDVLRMTERVKEKGLNIISAPGNDSVSTTILGMAGCQLVLFSTGRGTPFGGFMPTVKISSNTSLYEKKKKWIDFNAGDVNNENIESIKDKLFDFVIDVIEGKKTMNEINNFREIAIFKSGVTL